MSEWKTRTAAHLRAAQKWLSKAQRSFDEKKDIRGELDLMLAQAELKHAQEAKRSTETRFRYACYRQGGALFCAVLIFGIGSLIWMGCSDHEPTVPTSSPVQTTSAHRAEPIASQVSAAAADEALVPRTNAARYEAHNEAQTAPAVSLSRKEMQDILQAAGRSLRGQ